MNDFVVQREPERENGGERIKIESDLGFCLLTIFHFTIHRPTFSITSSKKIPLERRRERPKKQEARR